jgi:hypothetical protein
MHFRDDDVIDDVPMKGRRGSIYVPYTTHQVRVSVLGSELRFVEYQ